MNIGNVLSCFDGISCGQIALSRADLQYDNYFASEIDKHAIKVTQSNWPDTKQLGDIINIKSENLPKIELLIGGSPCQGFSCVGKQLNFEDTRSKLFFEYVRLLRELKPKYFLLENVRLNNKCRDIISSFLNVKPIQLNSELVSGQYRKRLYWTNIPNVVEPTNRNIYFDKNVWRRGHGWFEEHVKFYRKSPCITTHISHDFNIIDKNNIKRQFTPQECEILQTMPINYTSQLSNHQRYKCLGNCWTVDIISHILSFIPRC